MGNVCCGGNEETKASALDGPSRPDHDVTDHGSGASSSFPGHTALPDPSTESTNLASSAPTSTPQEQKLAQEQQRVQAREQARLALIVNKTGQSMVAVRSTRGSNAYYDQGFAAALAQHLEQTTRFAAQVPSRLPPPNARESVYARLTAAPWHGIQLGPKDGLAGCAGENPNTYMDHVAESYLDSVVPKKEGFSNARPIVENLL
ncbi:predicted protein [Phaeodactylum tricornutum CCAP 1055/1]|jgi:hypothetical protein|uniref:Uncharacterized protein n=1 Tax=Phaeodactylum tricornutum (strain CCAP 1055/1) TaxID=556484 RepID=B7G013_PHATC|nr:predicted protein [Phaeodactylum tricornutum CCAP 1055/1]EEC48007.1 predicted protein [Phaeodactylum tricornutum CCAP 1055/1]|eukprot:XP_002180599.1 predicted protein [Phaeodactylum tricornutum CCAP 1055/1]